MAGCYEQPKEQYGVSEGASGMNSVISVLSTITPIVDAGLSLHDASYQYQERVAECLNTEIRIKQVKSVDSLKLRDILTIINDVKSDFRHSSKNWLDAN